MSFAGNINVAFSIAMHNGHELTNCDVIMNARSFYEPTKLFALELI